MNTVIVLIAHGANELQIPCRLFENMEAGRQVCDKIFGMEGKVSESKNIIAYRKDLDGDDEEIVISEQLFTHFYYGCGGPYRFTLEEIPFDTKFVPFDLD